MSPKTADLVVLSHLRWIWVWQRPQHLVSRFAAERGAVGARTWFIEEPVVADVTAPIVKCQQRDGITRLWLEVPPTRKEGYPGFDDPRAENYASLIQQRLQEEGVDGPVEVLLYTPMALDIAHALEPRRLFYDVMDDLASFLGAAQSMVLRQRQLLAKADVVFAGGRSLHQGISQHRKGDCHLFPSGVDTAHYQISRPLRAGRSQSEPPVAGYVGVIDERMDLALLEGLAAALPDWQIRIVGPVAKIDPATLPQAPNLEYTGFAAYADLPKIMAGFDVALMPFALNQATRSISPTKTLEYLAAGLPVVSTRVPDVVTDHAQLVYFANDAAAFATACREQLAAAGKIGRSRGLETLAERHSWDYIAAAMTELMHKSARESVDLAERTA